MDFFDEPSVEQKSVEDFISHICNGLQMDKENFRKKFCDHCLSGSTAADSLVYETVVNLFRYDCFTSDKSRLKKTKMTLLTKLFEFLIAGDPGIQNIGRKLKEYDYSARCSLVWTTNYFAYRCRTCGLSPSMSLCGSCFTAGNHFGHDFNKFKSLAGGACDCGNSTVMHPSGYCRFHGPDKVHNRPSPPEELIAPLRCLLPRFLPALLFWFWDICTHTDPTTLTEEVAPALYVLHVLHACGWVTQKMIADVLLDREVFNNLKSACANEMDYNDYVLSVQTDPGFNLPPAIADQTLIHRHLLDAFVFCTIKLRFPESLVTFLIGLLAVEEFKEEFVQSYLNHYTRIASTVMISARTRMLTDWSLQMNNRIVHISVQLFSGEDLALRMVRERRLHYLLVHCLLSMCECCRTRMDDRNNMVVNCDGPFIQNNVFWPFVSDLSNLVSHKSIVDEFVHDSEFLQAWTKILRYMQFMNCFVLREGDHIEYETMAFYHAFTMEIEISANPMWNIWQHYREPSERHHCLAYTSACLSTLGGLLANLGRLTSPSLLCTHPFRSPLSLHLPLMRHTSCFLSLAVMQHGADLRHVLSDYLLPKPFLLWRFMDELANTLLGCHEVVLGYWIRNGQALRQSITHYMQSQFCYSFIDLDIFAFQACASLLPPAHVLNTLLDPTRLLRGVHFYDELLRLVAPPDPRNLDRKPMAVEAWLLNLCWVLDLRNNICLTENELLQKELVCVLAPEHRKRSDLSSLIPERCGIGSLHTNLDEVLKKVATFSGPSCDEASGSVMSGHYSLRPSLWHTDFDPVFHSLRAPNRRDTAAALAKYREHCRQRHGVANPSVLWPPYRTPKPLPENFLGLDHILHSRHLHFILFIQLSLYVYGDPLVTEESVSLIVHLLSRALDTPCRVDSRDNKCCTTMTQKDLGAEPMQVDPAEMSGARRGSDDQLAESTHHLTDDANEMESSDLLMGEADEAGRTGEETVEFGWKPMNSGRSRSPFGTDPPFGSTIDSLPSDSPTASTSRRSRSPRWDPSLFKCPYTPRSSLLENLSCWLVVDPFPSPRVSAAPTMLATSMASSSEKVDPVISSIPNLTNSEVQGSDTFGLLVDSLLSLLIKAHTRLHGSRASDTNEAVPKVLAGNVFTDPNRAVARAPAEPTEAINATADATNVVFNEQMHNLLNLPAPFLDWMASNSMVNLPTPVVEMQPRCTAVLGDQNLMSTTSDSQEQEGQKEQSNNMANAEQESATGVRSTGAMNRDGLAKVAPELRYFGMSPPTYLLPDERRQREAVSNEMDTGGGGGTEDTTPICPNLNDDCYSEVDRENLLSGSQCTTHGDGAFYIERLLDKIASTSPQNDASVRLYLARARRPFDSIARPVGSLVSGESIVAKPNATKVDEVINRRPTDSPDPTGRQSANSMLTGAPAAATASREERKKAALERRKRLMEQMALKQKAFASTHLKDLELINQPVEKTQAELDDGANNYECVICQTAGTSDSDDMLLLDMMCESGSSILFRETSFLPGLQERHPKQASGVAAELPTNRDAYSLIATRPPVILSSADSDSSTSHTNTQSAVIPANSSGQAPTGTVGVSVIATNFDFGAQNASPSTPVISASPVATPSLGPVSLEQSPSPVVWLSDVNVVPSISAAVNATPTPSSQPCHVESRRWWSLALASEVTEHLPLLRSGLLLQTCGHVVHRECFQRYRTQGAGRSGANRNRGWVSCPLCRRDVHHFLPLVPVPKSTTVTSGPTEHISILESALESLTKTGKSVWDDLNGLDDDTTMQRRTLMSRLLGQRFEATVLLRSQLECELAVLMCCPSQYSIVARRCSWREFLSYMRLIYRSSDDLKSLLDCLTKDTTLPLPDNSDSPFPPIYALYCDPGDILLSLIPHVWPREDLFLTLVSATISLAYVRSVASALFNLELDSKSADAEGSPCQQAESMISQLSGPIASHAQHLLGLLRSIPPTTDLTAAVDIQNPCDTSLLQTAALLSDPLSDDKADLLRTTQARFELHVVLRMLPLLRLASLCRARWYTTTTRGGAGPQDAPKPSTTLVPTGLPFVSQLTPPSTASPVLTLTSRSGWSEGIATNNPHITAEQRLLEFSDLSRILSLDCGDTAVVNVADVAELATVRSGLLNSSHAADICLLMDRWVNQISNPPANDSNILVRVAHGQWQENLRGLLEMGRQLYAPRLIRTPHCFDVLFNALHVISCDTVQHRFQENALCLICGRLLCTLCSNLPTVMVEHAYSCEGFCGVVLEVNTSIVYVSLGPAVCDWGSIYLDAYGEEDLELKRGKPLYLNNERFTLLENQWLTHSFRHVLKHWRTV